MEVPRRRADRRPLRVALAVQHVLDDGVLVDGVGHRAAEVDVAEPGPLLRREVGRARFRVHARVHVERQERGPEGRPPAVDREVPLLLQRLEARVFLPQQPVVVRLSRLERRQLGREVRHDAVVHRLEVGQAGAVGVAQPVVPVAAQRQPRAGDVLLDREGPGPDDLRGVGVEAPGLVERPRVDGRLQDVLRVDRLSHRAQEGGEGHGQRELHRVVVHDGHRHRRLAPLPALRVREAEREGRAVVARDVVVVDDPVERELDIGRRERLPVVPGDVAAQVERPGEAVGRVLPGLRQRRFHLVRQPRDLGQALEQVAEVGGRSRVVREGQVEGQRLDDRGVGQTAARRADAVLELVGVGLQRRDDAGLGRVTARDRQQHRQERQRRQRPPGGAAPEAPPTRSPSQPAATPCRHDPSPPSDDARPIGAASAAGRGRPPSPSGMYRILQRMPVL